MSILFLDQVWLPVCLIAIHFLPAVLGAVILTPQNDSIVPYNSNEIYTYDCETDSGGQLFWGIDEPEGNLNVQLQPDSSLNNHYATKYGIIVEDQPSFPNRTRLNFNVTRFSQSTFRQEHGSTVVLECRTFDSRGPTQSIFVYGPLDTPSDLVFSALSETHLNLSWTGTDIPRGGQVINHVQVTNLSSGVTQEFNTTDGYIPFDETGECSEFNLTVMSSNELVGESGVGFTLQNIPISPDVSPVSESLTTRVDFDDDDITIMIMFKPANVCNLEKFPVENYTVVLVETNDRLPTSHFDDNQIQAVVNNTVIPGLSMDQAINYYVEVCSNVTCRTTGISTAYTTGVQTPIVYYVQNSTHVLVTCDFAGGSTASGCSFNFTFATTDEVDSEQYNILRDSKENSTLCNGGSQACMCINGTERFVDSYSTIEAFTLEEDGATRSRISVPVIERNVSDTRGMIEVCLGGMDTMDPEDNITFTVIIIGVAGGFLFCTTMITVTCAVYMCTKKNPQIHYHKQHGETEGRELISYPSEEKFLQVQVEKTTENLSSELQPVHSDNEITLPHVHEFKIKGRIEEISDSYCKVYYNEAEFKNQTKVLYSTLQTKM